ncbi:MAG: sugar ABC transporter substrate-binding protein, partial [Acidobacteria bacterium]|nr:sugar ABC transporter substrate-binding protein [Acidobacteriota bacterium]
MKRWMLAVLLLPLCLLSACNQNNEPKQPTIGVSFETLQTEYWVAGFEAIKTEAKKRNLNVLEAIADGDANRQLEQINNFIARGVDGIIAVPKDAKTIIPMIKAANAANIPIVLYNRPADKTDAKSVAVVADNFAITKATVEYMCEQAKKSGRKYKALLLMGDLGDINAIGRRDGFEEAVKGYSDIIEVVARVPTEWNQEKAQAGVTNALQAHPDINFI